MGGYPLASFDSQGMGGYPYLPHMGWVGIPYFVHRGWVSISILGHFRVVCNDRAKKVYKEKRDRQSVTLSYSLRSKEVKEVKEV